MPPTDFLVFGEDDNDRRAIAHLVKAIISSGSKAKITPVRKPIILSRDAQPKKRATMSEAIANIARGFEVAKKIPAVVVHRDCDATEPTHIEVIAALEKDLRDAGVKLFVVAAPAWEIEAWWMLFPKALRAVRPSWNKIDYGKQHVGKFANAKERLIRDLRPVKKNANCPDFRESDGIRVAEIVVADSSHLTTIEAQSDSFAAFKDKLLAVNADKPSA